MPNGLPDWLRVTVEIVPLLALIGAAVGGVITLWTYRQNTRLRRAEWLFSLFDKFFCQDKYAKIRRAIDYDDKKEFERLRSAVETHADASLEEQFVDYLNFFEFVATLETLGHLRLDEVERVFDYYLRGLDKHSFITQYLRDNGFEGLRDLLAKLPARSGA